MKFFSDLRAVCLSAFLFLPNVTASSMSETSPNGYRSNLQTNLYKSQTIPPQLLNFRHLSEVPYVIALLNLHVALIASTLPLATHAFFNWPTLAQLLPSSALILGGTLSSTPDLPTVDDADSLILFLKKTETTGAASLSNAVARWNIPRHDITWFRHLLTDIIFPMRTTAVLELARKNPPSNRHKEEWMEALVYLDKASDAIKRHFRNHGPVFFGHYTTKLDDEGRLKFAIGQLFPDAIAYLEEEEGKIILHTLWFLRMKELLMPPIGANRKEWLASLSFLTTTGVDAQNRMVMPIQFRNGLFHGYPEIEIHSERSRLSLLPAKTYRPESPPALALPMHTISATPWTGRWVASVTSKPRLKIKEFSHLPSHQESLLLPDSNKKVVVLQVDGVTSKIKLYPLKVWEERVFANEPAIPSAAEQFNRLVFGNAFVVDVDRHDRIFFTDPILKAAGWTSEPKHLLVEGHGDYFEISVVPSNAVTGLKAKRRTRLQNYPLDSAA